MAARGSRVCLGVEAALMLAAACELGNEHRQAGNKPQKWLRMGRISAERLKIAFCFDAGIQHRSDSQGVGVSYSVVLVRCCLSAFLAAAAG